MVAVPAVLFYLTLAALGLFAVLGVIALGFAIALLVSLYRLARMAHNGIEEARQKIVYMQDFFLTVSGL